VRVQKFPGGKPADPMADKDPGRRQMTPEQQTAMPAAGRTQEMAAPVSMDEFKNVRQKFNAARTPSRCSKRSASNEHKLLSGYHCHDQTPDANQFWALYRTANVRANCHKDLVVTARRQAARHLAKE